MSRSHGFFTSPISDFWSGFERCLDRGARGLAFVFLGLGAGWWVYVPVHELLHAGACLAAGGSVRLGAVSPTRDFNYVADTVAGFIAAAVAGDPVLGQVVNLAANDEISVADTAALIADVMGQPLHLETDEQRIRPESSEVERLCGDNTRAAALLNWAPGHSGRDGLRRGLEHTVAWFTDAANRALYRPAQYTV